MYDSGKMDANLTATELMKKMGQGWNLGNTLEACGSAKETQGFTPEDFETFWQKVPTTQTTMDGTTAMVSIQCVFRQPGQT